MATPPLVVDGNYREQLTGAMGRVYAALPPGDVEDMFKPDDGDTLDFIFEVYIFFTLALNLLHQGWSLKARNVKSGKFLLPRSPATKKNFSYFFAQKNEEAWHLVHGTEIVSRIPKKTVAPDVSLQAPDSGDTPSARHVAGIWDAKFRTVTEGKHSDRRITDNEYRSFVWVRKALGVPPWGRKSCLASFPRAFQVCSLVTNGLRPTGSLSMFLHDGVSVVERFQGGDARCWPSPKQHLAYARYREHSRPSFRPKRVRLARGLPIQIPHAIIADL